MRVLIYGLLMLLMSSCDESDKNVGLVLPPTTDEVKILAAKPVDKSNKLPVYMHYMPWFEAPGAFSNGWGLHWKMGNRNPDIIDEDKKRQIASHFYPLIGPYDSREPAVIQYHMLLMKYAGVDGLLINWYGEKGTNGDINSLLESSNAIIAQTKSTGMKFSVVMEDRFAGTIDDTKANLAYLDSKYYTNSQYIQHEDKPLTLLFGPITFNSADKWKEILASSSANEVFLPLWYTTSKVGSENASGEYSWVYKDYLNGLKNFYNSSATRSVNGGSAYPGFDDYYVEGGWGDQIGWSIDVSKATMKATLDLAAANSSKLDFLQLVTWNDFGEGTNIEPTREFGFDFLLEIQKFTGVSYGQDELQLIYDWYLLSIDADIAVDKKAADQIKQAYYHLVALEVTKAQAIISKYKKS
jgi:hypothetical protein